MTRSIRHPLITLAFFILAAVSSDAQSPHVHLQRFEVAIWPEYDRPAALVMYRGWLAPDVELPTTVTLPLPSEVTAPNAVAKRGPGTGLLVAPHTIESFEGKNLIHLQTDLPEIRVEFYVDLATDQSGRAFTFEWPGGPVIDEAFYEVMQPLGATDFAATPSSAPPALGQDGLMYQREELGPISEGAPFYIQFAYNKNTPDLTASALQQTFPPPVQPSSPAPASEAPAAQPAGSGSSQWIITVTIVVAAGLLLLWFVVSGKKD